MADAALHVPAPDEAFTDRIVVRFEGSGPGSGPPAWGQWEIWDTMRGYMHFEEPGCAAVGAAV